MRIGINLGFFLLEDNDWKQMVKVLFENLAKNWPSNNFVFFTEKKIAAYLPNSQNISIVVLPDLPNNGLGLKIWYDYKLVWQIKAAKVDILVNTGYSNSLRIKIPQVLFVKDFALFNSASSPKSKSGFLKKRCLKSLGKAEAIIAFDQSIIEKMVADYAIPMQKIKLANFVANPGLQPMGWQQKELVKEKYSEGKEFFLFNLIDGTVDPLVLLKAFSLFKKRQQSNMQFLVVGDIEKYAKGIVAKLPTYKYRSEVKMLDNLIPSETFELLSAAYCLIHFSNLTIDLPILKAMQIGVPAIMLKKEEGDEILAGTVLYASAESADSIAEQMKIIYKDENLRSRMITAGLNVTEINTVEKSSASVWSAIQQATGNTI